jgi:hypothetical protein
MPKESSTMPFKFDAAGNVAVQEINGQKLPIFVHADGKEIPFDVDGTIATIGRLNGEAKAHREAKEAAEAALKPFKDAGIADATKAAKALATVQNLDDKKLVDAGDVERVKTEAIRAVEERFAPVVKENETLKGQLHSHMVGGAFSRSKFIAEKFAAEGPAGVEIAQALFGNRLKVEDGKVVGYDQHGAKLYSRARPGELADTDEAIELMVDAYPHKAHILKAPNASGGGAAGNKPGANSAGSDLFKLPARERLTAARANQRK